eukprot:5156774-Pleurochrysis_carterae.AAC.3
MASTLRPCDHEHALLFTPVERFRPHLEAVARRHEPRSVLQISWRALHVHYNFLSWLRERVRCCRTEGGPQPPPADAVCARCARSDSLAQHWHPWWQLPRPAREAAAESPRTLRARHLGRPPRSSELPSTPATPC